jgi:hypothetical protein
MTVTPLSSKIWFSVAIFSWMVAIGGLIIAQLFLGTEPLSGDLRNRIVVSPRAFVQMLSFLAGFLVATVSFLGTTISIFVSQNRDRLIIAAFTLSALLSAPGWLYLAYLIVRRSG